jgi:wyosine [tRNA(Phe)-imidazoG37] synthetase (radical SAM superfamily)
MIAFGPIPSRRLGQSLGVNNIPLKNYTYDCVYCQVGSTSSDALESRTFYSPEAILQAVQQRVQEVQAAGGHIDYLSIVPDGEPSLDVQLGASIQALRPLGIKIAVITNSSLLWREQVRQNLALADLVSLKVDTVLEESWRKINRPNRQLSLPAILRGALAFARDFQGKLITETMLVRGINDQESTLQATAAFLGQLDPDVAYLAIPTRPPTEKNIQPPDETTLNRAYQIFSQQVRKAECLTGFSPDTFSASGDVLQNLLNITAVHPVRESEVLSLLKRGGYEAQALDFLVDEGKLARVLHQDVPFYVRKFSA